MHINSKLDLLTRCYFGGPKPQAPVAPPTAPTQTGAAKQIQDKNPTRNARGTDATILTQPTNLMQQERNQKKTLLGE